jgi:carbon starvation protein
VQGAFAWLAFVSWRARERAWLVTAAVCTYLIAYRFYSRIHRDEDLRARRDRTTPAERLNDGRDYVPTNRWIVFRPPLRRHRRSRAARRADARGAVRLPARHDLDSRRRRARRRGAGLRDPLFVGSPKRKIARADGEEEIGPVAGYTALIAVLGIMIVLIAVLALVVVNALGESPWGVVTVGLTIPIALLMGGICVDPAASGARSDAMRHRAC